MSYCIGRNNRAIWHISPFGVQYDDDVRSRAEVEEHSMQPEWSEDPNVPTGMLLLGLTGLISFALMVWVFAFYW